MFVREGVNFGGKELSIETGRMAKQADGSVVVRYGDTMVLVTAVARDIRPGVDFMPLTVDYLEKTSAAGRIPGGYFKREGRMTEVEVLTSRLIDRPSRPLFPKGWRFDTQVIAMVVSTDRENAVGRAGDDRRLDGAAPLGHPVGGSVRGRPRRPHRRQVRRQPDLRRARAVRTSTWSWPASRDAIVMVEGGAAELGEDVIVDALMFAHQAAQPLIDLQEKLRAAVGKPKREFVPPVKDPAIVERVGGAREPEDRSGDGHPRQARALRGARRRRRARPRRRSRRRSPIAAPRSARRTSRRRRSTCASWCSTPAAASTAAPPPTSGRSPARSACCRGRTARRCSRAARPRRWSRPRSGTSQDAQHIEALTGNIDKRFMLHYNFPPFSTGETKPLRGASRREVGHGNLAERAIARVLPSEKDFPYTIRDRLGDPRVQRQLVDGVGLRRHPVADGRRRPDQDAGGRHRDGPDQGRRPRRRPVRHPRRRGSPRRHGLQDLRHQAGRHRRPDGHQDPGPDARDPGDGAAPGPRGPAPHPRQDGGGAGRPARGAVAATRRASTRCRSSPTRSARSSARAARPSAASPRRPASRSTSRTTAPCTSRRRTASRSRRRSTSSRA